MICTSSISYRRRRWVVSDGETLRPGSLENVAEVVARLSQELKVPELVCRILVNRGIDCATAGLDFLEPKFKDIHHPSKLPNIDAAAERIVRAVKEKEKITLYGDYDVDGITGTAMLWQTLKAAGANVETYIPHRVEEGYGLNVEAVKSLIAGGTRLLITIDCGCSAVEAIACARDQGVDVVVSDHHEFGAELPPAYAIVHPRWAGDADGGSEKGYPNPDLCGAGVAFKLAWAVAVKLCGSEKVNDVYRGLLLDFCALAALGTIADVVPLVGENRILVKHGLLQLGRTRMPGLKAFIEAAGYHEGEGGKKLDTTAVGFTLGPRINAAGRMGHAREAVELLTTATGERAKEIATYLESQNRTRQATERKMVEIANQQLRDLHAIDPTDEHAPLDLPHCVVVADGSFHAGVVGIVASRLVETHHRPTFVLTEKDGILHGSGRSIAGFALHEAIEHCRDLLLSGGGHAMAGGVKLESEKLPEFRQRLDEYAAVRLSEEMLTPTIAADGVVSLADCNARLAELLEKLEPFGRGNPRPRFVLEGVRLSAPPRRVGATGTHLQLTVASGASVGRCIAFKMGDLEPQLPVGTDLRLVVELRVDRYMSTPRVDLQVVDIARADGEPFEIY